MKSYQNKHITKIGFNYTINVPNMKIVAYLSEF